MIKQKETKQEPKNNEPASAKEQQVLQPLTWLQNQLGEKAGIALYLLIVIPFIVLMLAWGIMRTIYNVFIAALFMLLLCFKTFFEWLLKKATKKSRSRNTLTNKL